MSRKSKQRVQPSGDRAATRAEEEARRAAKAEESMRRKKRAAFWRTLRIVGIPIAVFVLVAAAYAWLPRSANDSRGGGPLIEGLQIYSNETGHVLGPVDYPQTPPAGGQHDPTWLNCGIYNLPVPNENAVHALEHGAVWVTYDPALDAGDLDALRMRLPSTYVVLSPYEGLPAPIVLSAWHAQLSVESAGDERLPLFLEEYWRSRNVPEPGALCAGGLNAPGRVS